MAGSLIYEPECGVPFCSRKNDRNFPFPVLAWRRWWQVTDFLWWFHQIWDDRNSYELIPSMWNGNLLLEFVDGLLVTMVTFKKAMLQHGEVRWEICEVGVLFVSFLWLAFSSLFSILLSIFALEIPHDFSFVPPFDGTWHVENGPAKAILALDSLELYWEGSACMRLRCFQAFTSVSRHLL